MTTRGQTAAVPVITLPKGVVLFPGIQQRIAVTPDRPDLAAILNHIYSRAGPGSKQTSPDAVSVACVPMASPFLGRKGQLLLPAGTHGRPNSADIPEFNVEKTRRSDLFGCGVAAKITAIQGQPGESGGFSFIVDGQSRVLVESISQERPFFQGKVTWYHDEITITSEKLEESFKRLKRLSLELVRSITLTSMLSLGNRSSSFNPELAQRLRSYIGSRSIGMAGSLADFMAHIAGPSYEEKLQILASFEPESRVAKAIELLERQIGEIMNNLKVTTITAATWSPITGHPSEEDEDQQWSPFKRPKPGQQTLPNNILVPPQGLLGGPKGASPDDKEPDEIQELQKKLEEAKLSPEAAKVAEKELRRLRKMSPAQAEHAVTRSYLETLADIPWSAVSDDQLGPETLPRARKQLDDDHYGLEKVKKRLMEYLAVLRLKQSVNEDVETQIKKSEDELAALELGKTDSSHAHPSQDTVKDKAAASAKLDILRGKRLVDKSPILLLVGPPGVGKTSLARSIATALGRKFHRISLGGVRDEAEIRGHRRTYVAAMPGLIIQGLRKVTVANPVFLLDEIDKLGGSNHHGDPSAAMLEVLDPEQNHTFVDHYVAVPYDLSRVLFIATANSLDTIPPPLLDRMETIYLPGYTTLEKRHIATQHLVPKQVRSNGLAEDQVVFGPEVVSKIIESYTRESGVRNLEREIGSVCRAKAVEYADAKDADTLGAYRPQLTVEDIERILGIEKFDEEIAETTSRPGIVTGLVAYSSGGDGSILFIEVADMPGSGTVQLTGNLRSVLKESVEVALSWVKAHAYELGLAQDPDENIMKNRSIHVHCPSGAIPKDGPSSGIAQAIALISLFSGRAVPPTLAMTGEITLRGRVTRVGGIQEKLIGALRAGVKTVILPAQNRKDAKEVPQEVKDGLEIFYVTHAWEAIRHVWPDATFPGEQPFPNVESRL